MAKKKHRPHDPAEAARKAAENRGNPAAWGKNEAALSLAANADVVVEPGDRSKVERIRRYDVFHILVTRAAPAERKVLEAAEKAVRRLEEIVATLHRTAGQQDGMGSGSVQSYAVANCEAGGELRKILSHLDATSRKVMTALCQAHVVEGRDNWHQVVFKATGLIMDGERRDVVKRAMMATLRAFQVVDNQPRSKAA